MKLDDEARVTALRAFAERAAAALGADERVCVVWLTGSLAAGTADAQSDVDLRLAVRAADFAEMAATGWEALLKQVSPLVWWRRWSNSPQEVVTGAITTDYTRFDLVFQPVDTTHLRTRAAARVLLDRDDLARRLIQTAPATHDPTPQIPSVVEEFIRLVGMLPLVVGRDDVAMGMEGQMGLHSLLISLLLLENGIDRATMGKRHVAAHLNAEQRAVLASVPTLAPTMESVIAGRLAYARLFLPRARRLMAAHDLPYPDAFEVATRQHLRDTLGVTF